MMGRSRVASAPDMGRIGAALARPGMDTRTWVSLAYVQAYVVDPDAGPIVDVILVPGGQQDTARVGSEYAGNGWGLYCPLAVDDEVLVEAPSGDPNEGLVVTKRLWSKADPPPPGAADNPADVLLFVQPDKNLRITTSGQGQITITSAQAVSVSAPTVTVDAGAAGTVQVNSGTVNVGNAVSKVNLGPAVAPVARTGDTVVGTAGPYPIVAVVGPSPSDPNLTVMT